MRDASSTKYHDGTRLQRPFGGLNIILSGDLWQLEPPTGTFLGALPTAMLEKGSIRRGPTAAYGQLLVWGGPDHGIQGVTELTICERTKDEWLRELQEEMRVGKLSDDMHAFLHGQPTTVPGSWCRGDVLCKSQACRILRRAHKATEITMLECETCRLERASRRLVSNGPQDVRYTREFASAPAIFATNDVKHHVNKIRAAAFARDRSQKLILLPARDKISATALREKPDLAATKKQWLKRHDRACESLYGLLPLCVGMPVRLTDHIDRSKKSLLKGRLGVVRGWQSEVGTAINDLGSVASFKKMPEVVWVEFPSQKQTWKLKGVPQANIYPVVPRSATWYLDRNRKHPMLRISRRQVPLAPAFALTAHTAQGMTLEEGVIADCDVPPGTNIITCYIAVTRVRQRSKLLISRPFAAAPFQQGLTGQRDLLLQCWRGNPPDWAAVRERYNVTKRCSTCDIHKRTNAFTKPQWLAADTTRVCKECVRMFVEQNKPWRCAVCLNFQEIICFPKETKNPKKTWTRVCNSCVAVRRCCRCGKTRKADMYSEQQWRRGSKTGHCKLCNRKRGLKSCPVVRVGFDRARRFVAATLRKRAMQQVWRAVHEVLRQKNSSSLCKRQQTSRVEQSVSRPARCVPCPSCGYEVTTRAKKRVKKLHRRPDGTVCPQEQWYVA